MTANVAPPGLTQIFTDNGAPAALYKVWTYDSGTATPRTTWADAGEVTPNANPVVLDANGRAQIYYRGNYRIVLTTPANAVVWTQDNFNVVDPSASVSTVFADGSAATPSVRFAQATSSGLFSPAANVVAMSINGAEATRWSAGNFGVGGTPTQKLDVFGTARIQGALTITTGGITVTSGGILVTAGGLTVTAGGLVVTAGGFSVAAGGAAVTGNSTVTGDLTVTGTLTAAGLTIGPTAFRLVSTDGLAITRNVTLTVGTWQILLDTRCTYDFAGNGTFTATQNASCGGSTASTSVSFTRSGASGHGYQIHGSGIAVASVVVAAQASYTMSIASIVLPSGGIARGSVMTLEKVA